MSNGPSDVFILQTGRGYLVRPAVFVARDPFTITFRNLTGAAASLHFPQPGFKAESSSVPPDGQTRVVVDPAVPAGYYPYAVSIESGRAPAVFRDFAHGESSPGVIIDK